MSSKSDISSNFDDHTLPLLTGEPLFDEVSIFRHVGRGTEMYTKTIFLHVDDVGVLGFPSVTRLTSLLLDLLEGVVGGRMYCLSGDGWRPFHGVRLARRCGQRSMVGTGRRSYRIWTRLMG
jgi:hypothetical protein